jgi:hypothetical protein
MDHGRKRGPACSPARIGRRDFIAGSSTCLLAGLALDARAAVARPENDPVRSSAPAAALAVGYSPCIATPEAPGTTSPAPRIVSACTLPPGDPAAFARGALVTIHGLRGPAPATPVSVRALFRIDDGAGRIETAFDAWSCAPSPVPSESSPVRFRMPVDPHDGIVLALSLSSDPGGAARAALSLGGPANVPRLHPGWYFIALPDGPGLPVEWEAWRFAGLPEGLCRTATGAPAAFPYLTLSLRPAGPEPVRPE